MSIGTPKEGVPIKIFVASRRRQVKKTPTILLENI